MRDLILFCSLLMSVVTGLELAFGPKAQAGFFHRCEKFFSFNREKEEKGSSARPRNKYIEKNQDLKQARENYTKKRVLIITHHGGGGHLAAAKAVEASLGGGAYEFKQVDFREDTMDSEIFDYVATKESWGLMSLMVGMQGLAEASFDFSSSSDVMKAFIDYNPNLIISVQPVANYVYRQAANKLGIPFMIIPTDLDIRGFLNNLSNIIDEQDTTLAISLDDPEIVKVLTDNKIKTGFVSGYPLRAEFGEFAKKYREGNEEVVQAMVDLKEEYKMGPKDKMIFISLGAKGFGANTTNQYIELLAKNHQDIVAEGGKLHIALATGKNKGWKKDLDKISADLTSSNSSLELHAEGWLDANGMALRMAASDVNIIKPGGSTLAEALSLGKFIMMKSDSTQGLPWEKFNMETTTARGWGDSFLPTSKGRVDEKDFISKISLALDPSKRNFASDNEDLPPINNFNTKLREKVDQILGDVSSTTDPL